MFRSLGPVCPPSHPHLPKVCRRSEVLKFLSVPWPQAENIKQKSPNWQSVKYAKNKYKQSPFGGNIEIVLLWISNKSWGNGATVDIAFVMT